MLRIRLSHGKGTFDPHEVLPMDGKLCWIPADRLLTRAARILGERREVNARLELKQSEPRA